MGTIINHNIPALNSFNKMNFNNNANAKSMEKLSSGLGINRAADNAAGLAISEKMRGQIRGLDQAGKNSMDAVSLIQTAEGGLTETHSILQRMRELSVQSSNGVYKNEVDREAITDEVNALREEIDRIADATQFNGLELLNGKIGGKEYMSGSTGKFLATVGSTAGAVNADIKISGLKDGTKVTLVTGAAAASTSVEWKNGGTEVTIMISSATTLADLEAAFTAASNTEQADFDFSNFNITFSNTDTNKVFDLRKENSLVVGTTVGNFVGAATGLDGLRTNFTVNTRETASQAYYSIANLGHTTSGITATIRAKEAGADKNSLKVMITTGAFASAGLGAVTAKGEEKVTILEGGQVVLQLSAGATYSEKEINAIFDKFNAGVEIELGGKATVNTKLQAASYGDNTVGTGFGTHGGVALSQGTGTGAAGLNFHIGANGNDFEELILKVGDMSAKGLGIDGDKIDVSDQYKSKASIAVIDKAINTVAKGRSALGAAQNRLESTINNLTTTAENLTSSESRIRDVDMAKEMMNFTKMNILSQASQAMLAQANQQPQAVLQLLR